MFLLPRSFPFLPDPLFPTLPLLVILPPLNPQLTVAHAPPLSFIPTTSIHPLRFLLPFLPSSSFLETGVYYTDRAVPTFGWSVLRRRRMPLPSPPPSSTLHPYSLLPFLPSSCSARASGTSTVARSFSHSHHLRPPSPLLRVALTSARARFLSLPRLLPFSSHSLPSPSASVSVTTLTPTPQLLRRHPPHRRAHVRALRGGRPARARKKHGHHGDEVFYGRFVVSSCSVSLPRLGLLPRSFFVIFIFDGARAVDAHILPYRISPHSSPRFPSHPSPFCLLTQYSSRHVTPQFIHFLLHRLSRQCVRCRTILRPRRTQSAAAALSWVPLPVSSTGRRDAFCASLSPPVLRYFIFSSPHTTRCPNTTR